MERWQSHPLNQKSRQTKESWPSGDDYSSGEQQLAGVRVYVRDYGVPTFKIFMNNRGGEGARLGLPDVDDGFLFRLCEAAAGSGGMVCPHPETIEIAWVLRDRLKLKDPDGKGGLATWNATRPPFVEADAVQRSISREHCRRAALCRAHVLGTGAPRRIAPSPRRRCGSYRDLSALSHPRRFVVRRRYGQDQSAAS
jgi:hypothetical protein